MEPREGYTNRTMQAIRAGAQFVQTSFPDVAKLPKYAYSTPGTSNATLFATNYTVRGAHCPWGDGPLPCSSSCFPNNPALFHEAC